MHGEIYYLIPLSELEDFSKWPSLSWPLISVWVCVASLSSNPLATLFVREAHERSFRKRPFRSGLWLSCSPASRREPGKGHEYLLEHFGPVHRFSFRLDLDATPWSAVRTPSLARMGQSTRPMINQSGRRVPATAQWLRNTMPPVSG